MLRSLLIAWLSLAPLLAATIAVSGDSTAGLQPGDELAFTVSDYSYRIHAAAFHAPSDPARVSFSLISELGLPSWTLTATLESLDGMASAQFGDLTVGTAMYQGALYSGPVLLVSGTIQLGSTLSSQIFAGPSALIVLHDASGSATLGLPPYSLLQDLKVTFSGGNFSVGGVVAAVTLEQANTAAFQGSANTLFADVSADSGPETPEPGSFVLAALGGVLLAAWSRRRASRPGSSS